MADINQKTKILVLAHSSQGGGAELALASLIESTADIFEWSVVFCSLNQPRSELLRHLHKYWLLDLPWWCHEAHDAPRAVHKQTLEQSLSKLEHLAAQADILLTNTITVPWLGLMAPSLQKPHIWYIHEFGNIDHNLTFILGYQESLKIISECSSVVLAISNAIKEHLEKVVPPEKIHLIHQAIDLQNLLKIPLLKTLSKPVKLLCAGAMKPSKGQLIAARAAILLGNKSVLRIAGPSANQEYVKELQQIKSPMLQIDVGFTDLQKEYSKTDVLIMASGNEALGRITLEGIAAGRIVVGYDCPATREILDEGRGILYNPNTPEMLAETINKILSGATPRPKLGRARQYVAKTYSMGTQSADFAACVTRATLEGAPHRQSTNPLSDYLSFLGSHGLYKTFAAIRKDKLKGHISRLTPSRIKKIISSF